MKKKILTLSEEEYELLEATLNDQISLNSLNCDMRAKASKYTLLEKVKCIEPIVVDGTYMWHYIQPKGYGIGKLYINGELVPGLISILIRAKTSTDKRITFPSLSYSRIDEDGSVWNCNLSYDNLIETPHTQSKGLDMEWEKSNPNLFTLWDEFLIKEEEK